MNNRILAARAVAALAFVAASCSKPSTPDAAPAAHPFRISDTQRAKLTIAAVTPTTFTPTIDVTGTVAFNGDRSTQVLSPISGPVARLVATLGDSVAPGQLLATVASPDFAAAVAALRKAEATAVNTARIAVRASQLFQNDAIARADLDQARTDSTSAVADRDAAILALRGLGVPDATIAGIREGRLAAQVTGDIRAPIGGVVVERLINPGQLLAAGTTPAFTIADLSTMWIVANVYAADVAQLHRGDAVEITAEGSATPLHGVIDYIAPIVDPSTKATSVRVVAQNVRQLLRRDLFVELHLHTAAARKGILVPASAVMRDDENLPFVFIAQADGTFARRRVTVGYHVDKRYEITAGLAAGEKIVSDGALFIQFAESQ